MLDPPSVRPGEALVRSEAGGLRSAFITCSIDSNPPSKVRHDSDDDNDNDDDDDDLQVTWYHDGLLLDKVATVARNSSHQTLILEPVTERDIGE